MANYTMELRKVLEMGHQIFDFHYDFYDENRRLKFEQDFIRHFYFREIGQETVDRFKHYLQDKFMTVFPYYNSLFQAAQIEYNILDNYNIKEEYTITRENQDKMRGESYSVGQTAENQHSVVDTTQNTEDNVTTETGTTKEEHETIDTTAHKTGETFEETASTEEKTENAHKDETENIEKFGGESAEGETAKTSETNSSEDSKGVRKFLDTPQGILNLDSENYLTNLTQDEGQKTGTVGAIESGTNSEEKQFSESTERNATVDSEGNALGITNSETTGNSEENSESNSERNLSGSTTGNEVTNGTGSATGKTETTGSGEQKSTLDNNTRRFSEGTQTEKSVYTKKGNIGVDTDSDMIQKHIKLQKVLRKIELMFFDECEDLFMLVY